MEEDDIAAAMGFSSFGGTKKRKYDQTNSPKAKPDASGANSTRLGVRPKTVDESKLRDSKTHPEPVESIEGEETVLETTEAIPQPKGKLKQPAATGLADFLARGQALPDKPVATQHHARSNDQNDDSSSMVSFGGPAVPRAELNALRQGVKNDHGDIAYFLPSFVEDPWERLEKSKR